MFWFRKKKKIIFSYALLSGGLNFNHCQVVFFVFIPNFNPVNLQISSCKYVVSIKVDNRVDSDQMALTEAW